jgi:hypothetical protein
MDKPAELTLQILRRAHASIAGDAVAPPAEWLFVPSGARCAWSDARQFLADQPKPLLVAPLFDAGVVGLWTPHAIEPAWLAVDDVEVVHRA